MKTSYYIFTIFIVCLLSVYSCSDMNEFHDVYLRNGETLYVGHPDSVKVFPGKGRILLRYWIKDPKASKMKVYWNFRQDSVLFDIPDSQKGSPIDVIINGMEEKQHTLELVTYDSQMQHPSVPLKVQATVYNERFQSSLVGRSVKYTTFNSTDEIQILWQGQVQNGIGTEVIYNDANGVENKAFVPISDQSTTIKNYKDGLRYRTVFLPDSIAIDSFYTDLKVIDRIDKQIDKSLFKKWNPTGISYNDIGSAYVITKAWDNDLNTFYIFNIANSTYPISFTFDLGKLTKLNRLRHWQRLTATVVYRIQNVKTFALYGSPTENVNASYDGWILLGTFQSQKPSGLAKGQESAEDIAFATAGEDFIIDKAAPAVRYIRYEVIQTWDMAKAGAVGEMTFFGVDQ